MEISLIYNHLQNCLSNDNNERRESEEIITELVNSCNVEFIPAILEIINGSSNASIVQISLISLKNLISNLQDKTDLNDMVKVFSDIHSRISSYYETFIDKTCLLNFCKLGGLFMSHVIAPTKDAEINRLVLDYLLQQYSKTKEENQHRSFRYLVFLRAYLKGYEQETNYHVKDNVPFYNTLIDELNSQAFKLSQQAEAGTIDLSTIEMISLFGKIFKSCLVFIKGIDSNMLNVCFTILSVSLTKAALSPALIKCVHIITQVLMKYVSFNSLTATDFGKFLDLFFTIVDNEQISTFLYNNLASNSTDVEKHWEKFNLTILTFFRDVLSHCHAGPWFKEFAFENIFSESSIELSDYLEQFFSITKINNLQLYVLKNAFLIKRSEAEALDTAESFYFWFNSLSPAVDALQMGYLISRIIYSKFAKEASEIVNHLFGLLTSTNIESEKRAVLFYFHSIGDQFFLDETNCEMFVSILPTLFSSTDDLNLYITSRIVIEAMSFNKAVESYCKKLFINLSTNIANLPPLFKLGCIDFLFHFCDEIEFDDEIQNNLPMLIISLFAELLNYSDVNFIDKIFKTSKDLIANLSSDDASILLEQLANSLDHIWCPPKIQFQLPAYRSYIINLIEAVLLKADMQLVSSESLRSLVKLSLFAFNVTTDDREYIINDSVKFSIVLADKLVEWASQYNIDLAKVDLKTAEGKPLVVSELINTTYANVSAIINTNDYYLFYLLNIENLLCLNRQAAFEILSDFDLFSLLIDKISSFYFTDSIVVFNFFELLLLVSDFHTFYCKKIINVTLKILHSVLPDDKQDRLDIVSGCLQVMLLLSNTVPTDDLQMAMKILVDCIQNSKIKHAVNNKVINSVKKEVCGDDLVEEMNKLTEMVDSKLDGKLENNESVIKNSWLFIVNLIVSNEFHFVIQLQTEKLKNRWRKKLVEDRMQGVYFKHCLFQAKSSFLSN